MKTVPNVGAALCGQKILELHDLVSSAMWISTFYPTHEAKVIRLDSRAAVLLKPFDTFGFQPLIVKQLCDRAGDAFTKAVLTESGVASADDYFAAEGQVVADKSAITDTKTDWKRFVVRVADADRERNTICQRRLQIKYAKESLVLSGNGKVTSFNFKVCTSKSFLNRIKYIEMANRKPCLG